LLYRGMKDDGDGHPACGPSARMLGVRLEGDIPISQSGEVETGTGGLSVAIAGPENLIRHRRPPEYGGVGPDPVWEIDEADLPHALVFRIDPANRLRHGFIEPRDPMSFAAFQIALASSRGFWVRT
jgi:hypothetical protein